MAGSTQQMIKPEMPPDWADEFARLLDRQKAICLRLTECSQKQGEMLHSERAEDLLVLLADRQGLIDELTELGASMEPYRMAWPDLWSRLDGQRRQQFDRMIEEVQTLVDRIIASDRKDQFVLQKERSRIEREMKTVATGKATTGAYKKTNPIHRGNRTNRFMDTHG